MVVVKWFPSLNAELILRRILPIDDHSSAWSLVTL